MLVDVVHLNLGIDRHYEILGIDELWAATLHRIDEHDFRRYGFGVFQPSCGKGFGCEWCIEYGLYGRCVFLCDRLCRFLMYGDTSRGSRFSCLCRSCRNIPFKSCRPYGCGSVCSLRFGSLGNSRCGSCRLLSGRGVWCLVRWAYRLSGVGSRRYLLQRWILGSASNGVCDLANLF